MASLNQILLVGRLGGDPEMRFTTTGQAVTTFNLATDRKWKDAEGVEKKETIWFRINAWGKLAEVCNNFLAKGREVTVIGRAQKTRCYANNSTGEVVPAALDVVAATVLFHGANPGQKEEGAAEATEEAPAAVEEESF